MAGQTFKMRMVSSVRVKGPIITDATSAAVAAVVVSSVRKRISDAIGVTDAPAKPLTPNYAKRKSTFVKYGKEHTYMRSWTKAYKKYQSRRAAGMTFTKANRTSLWSKPIQNVRRGQGLGRPVRDLYFSGEMLDNLSIRRATAERITYALTARGPRMKAVANAKIEEWLGYSPKNESDIRQEAATQVANRIGELVIQQKPSD